MCKDFFVVLLRSSEVFASQEHQVSGGIEGDLGGQVWLIMPYYGFG
jgi:hypothetical protein